MVLQFWAISDFFRSDFPLFSPSGDAIPGVVHVADATPRNDENGIRQRMKSAN
jgi:hypothetical protein